MYRYTSKEHFFRDLNGFMHNHCFHMVSGVLAIVGLVFAFKELTWLVIVCGAAAFVLRQKGSTRNKRDWRYIRWYDPGIPRKLQSNTLALVLTAIGVVPACFLLKMDLVTGIFFSLSCAILLLYALALCNTIDLYIRFRLHSMRIAREIAKENKE